MADNTTLNPAAGGDVIRDIQRTAGGAKTQVIQLDIGGPETNAELLLNSGPQNMANSISVTAAYDQPPLPDARIQSWADMQNLFLAQQTASVGVRWIRRDYLTPPIITLISLDLTTSRL